MIYSYAARNLSTPVGRLFRSERARRPQVIIVHAHDTPDAEKTPSCAMPYSHCPYAQ